MLPDARESRPPRSPEPAPRKLRHRPGFAVKGPFPDRLLVSRAEIDDRGEVEVEPGAPQLEGRDEPGRLGERPAEGLIVVVSRADATRGGKLGEPFTEPLHAPSLVVHRDEERWRTKRVKLRGEGRERSRPGEVALEEDHAADRRVRRDLAILRIELRTGDVHHEGAESRGGDPVVRVRAHVRPRDGEGTGRHRASRWCAIRSISSRATRDPVSSTVQATPRSRSRVTSRPAYPHGSMPRKGARSRSTLTAMPW